MAGRYPPQWLDELRARADIVKGILDRYGLSYGVESKPGEGSTFWFEMPLAPDADEKE